MEQIAFEKKKKKKTQLFASAEVSNWTVSQGFFQIRLPRPA